MREQLLRPMGGPQTWIAALREPVARLRMRLFGLLDGTRDALLRIGPVWLAACLFALGAASVLLDPPVRPGLPATLGLVAVVSLAAMAWRMNPLFGLALAAPCALVLASAGCVLPAVLGPGLLLAATADHASAVARRRLIWLGVAGGAVGAEIMSDLDVPGSPATAQTLVLSALLWAVALLIGSEARRRRESLERIAAQAVALQESLEREHRLSAAEERTRLARDLHDSIGHAVNVIAIHAGAARLTMGDAGDAPRQSLETIEQVAASAAAELDALVGTLRGDDAASRMPGPSFERLAELIETYRSAGMRVDAVFAGSGLSPDVARGATAYRIVQEGLTNASRHGDGGPVQVTVCREPDALAVTITNGVSGVPAEATGGRGIRGMTERAALVGGTLVAERHEALFQLSARLPQGAA